MTATNIFYNFVGFRYSPPVDNKKMNFKNFVDDREKKDGTIISGRG